MASIRARLTATYAAALVGTMLVFGATLWVGRGAGSYEYLEREIGEEADAARRLAQAVRVRYSALTPRPHAASSTSFSARSSVRRAICRYSSSPPGGNTVSRLRRTRSSIDGPPSRGGGGMGSSSARFGMGESIEAAP